MIENFIRVWKSAISVDICKEIINCYELTLENHPELFTDSSKDSPRGRLLRKDLSIGMRFLVPSRDDLLASVSNKLFECLSDYKMEFPQLSYYDYDNMHYKIQKTNLGEGFHNWHYEHGATIETLRREIVWTVYLNDMPENEAETEFLYQSIKIRPEIGSVCLFPAAMTHVHRGLTVYTHPKYILTGWFTKILKEKD